jgi:nucleoid-associated protein YgaU
MQGSAAECMDVAYDTLPVFGFPGGLPGSRPRELRSPLRLVPTQGSVVGRWGSGAGFPGVATVRAAPDGVRLTARGRRLLVVLLLAGGVGLAALLSSWLGSGTGGLHLAGSSSVVVESGDTLWSIASSVAGSGDVRATVHQIRELNGLTSADIAPGQVLELP